MKALFIGGTGTISTAISELAVQMGIDLTILNRGNQLEDMPKGARFIQADINAEDDIKSLLKDEEFDTVANFINFIPSQVERDIRLFYKKTKQYIFISSASAYQKPMSHYLITESTPLTNPYWQYARDKIACENLLMDTYRDKGFPVTIVRPSHTYSKKVPADVYPDTGTWPVLQRMLHGKPVILHGDGLSLWTFMHSKDFAKAFIGLLVNPHAIGETFNITGDEVLTWDEAYRIISNILQVKLNCVYISSYTLVKHRPSLYGALLGDKSHCVLFDNSKIKRLVPGYYQTIRFDQGARMAWEYMLSNKKMQVENPEFDAWMDNMVEIIQKAETI